MSKWIRRECAGRQDRGATGEAPSTQQDRSPSLIAGDRRQRRRPRRRPSIGFVVPRRRGLVRRLAGGEPGARRPAEELAAPLELRPAERRRRACSAASAVGLRPRRTGAPAPARSRSTRPAPPAPKLGNAVATPAQRPSPGPAPGDGGGDAPGSGNGGSGVADDDEPRRCSRPSPSRSTASGDATSRTARPVHRSGAVTERPRRAPRAARAPRALPAARRTAVAARATTMTRVAIRTGDARSRSRPRLWTRQGLAGTLRDASPVGTRWPRQAHAEGVGAITARPRCRRPE